MNKEELANHFYETDTDVYTSLQDAFIAGWEAHEQHTHPHSTYMEFAEWYRNISITQAIISGPVTGLFQYWITNVKKK